MITLEKEKKKRLRVKYPSNMHSPAGPDLDQNSTWTYSE